MKVLYFCPAWGNSLPFDVFVKKVRKAGFDGIEMPLPLHNEVQKNEIIRLLQSEGLLFIGQQCEATGSNIFQHKAAYREHLYNLVSGKPLFINSQTGKDHYSSEINIEMINMADQFAAETGIPVLHETHRGKFSFAAHVTAAYLNTCSDLRIAADFSHWCNVAESMLEDQEEAISFAISRTDHIHARVGHPQGPQVPDPRLAPWSTYLEKHISWWDRIVKRAFDEGKEFFTITPEFGPVPYMPTQLFSNIPLSSQWDINVYMMEVLRTRYAKYR
jgi:sugar phosphate isomerase/epimerase